MYNYGDLLNNFQDNDYIFDRLLRELNKNPMIIGMRHKTPVLLLVMAFNWEKTPEGGKFWANVAKMAYNDLLVSVR